VARLPRWQLFNCCRWSLLKDARPERFPHRVPVDPGLLLSNFFPQHETPQDAKRKDLLSFRAGKSSWSGQCSYISGS
jgi:hypothetical protein